MPRRLPTAELGAGPPVALLHGFTQTGRSWDGVAGVLAADHRVITPDLPGHGAAAPSALSLPEAAALLAGTVGEATWVGYSMGGRHALQVALDHPRVVRGLVLLGATGGIRDPGERARRRALDEERARQLEREGIDAFLDAWLRQPLFASLDPARAGLDDRRRNSVAGLAGSLHLAGTGAQQPLWDRLAELGGRDLPVLVLAGEADPKFRAIAAELATAIGPSAKVAWVPGAGHAAHLEQPERFAAILRRWLAEHDL